MRYIFYLYQIHQIIINITGLIDFIMIQAQQKQLLLSPFQTCKIYKSHFIMFPPSTQSPTKKNRPNQLQKPFLQQSFRSKTQKAIQLINKHEEEKYNFLKTLNSSKKFTNISPTKNDHQYFSIVQIPQIFIQQAIKVQLLPYTDQYYKSQNPFFTNLHENNKQKSLAIEQQDETSSQGTIPIQNSQTRLKPTKHKKKASRSLLNKSLLENSNISTLETQCKIKIFIKNYRGASLQLLTYFEDNPSVKDFNFHTHKFMISSEKIISINMGDFIDKKWIYFRVKTRSQLAMFVMRLQKQSHVRKRVSTEVTEQFESSNRDEQKKRLPKLKESKSLKAFKSTEYDKNKSNIIKKSGSLILKPMAVSPSILTSSHELSPSSKKKNKEILQKLKKQQLQKKKQQQERKHEQILQKKTAIEIAKEKQLKLRSKALQMKKLVEQYKHIHEDQNYYRKFLLPKLAVLLILPRFNINCHQMIVERKNGMQMAIKTRALTKKFIKIIKNKHKQSTQLIRNKKIRQLVGVANLTTLFGKILHKNSTEKCYKIILATINITKPGQIINHCFDHATNYRRSIRYIQKTWLTQYKARMTMFQMYVKDQSQILMAKYPYFKYIYAKFITDNVHKTLAYKYLADQSSKLKYLFDDYKQKLQQIKEFNEMNTKIIEFNKTALKKRQKPLLEVPKNPCSPSLRYFRNISFLKSMIRGWFEVEYRKWSKINKVKSESVIALNSKGQGSPRKPIKRDASINSIELASPRKQQKTK